MLGENCRNFALRVVLVAGYDGVGRADVHTGGLQAYFHAVSTVITLGGGFVVRIDMDCIIRTGLHAGLAANAPTGIKVDDAIVTRGQGRNGTDRNARSIGAMVTPHDAEGAVRIGEVTLLDVLDPSAIDANRCVVLGLASHGAGMTADTLSIIDDERVIHFDTRKASYHNVVQTDPALLVKAGESIQSCIQSKRCL
jgi:hypothetical protein